MRWDSAGAGEGAPAAVCETWSATAWCWIREGEEDGNRYWEKDLPMERRRLRKPLGGAAGRKAVHYSHDASLAAGSGIREGQRAGHQDHGRELGGCGEAAKLGGGGGSSGGRGSRRGATGVFPLREWRRRDLGN